MTETKLKARTVLVRFQKALQILQREGVRPLFDRILAKISANHEMSISPLGEIKWPASTPPPVYFVGKKLSGSRLKEAILRNMTHDRYILALSHNDYTQNVGGVQLKIADEQVAENDREISYLHIFPYGARQTLVFDDECPVSGINLDGREIGFVNEETLLEVIKELPGKQVSEVRIHHSMGFKMKYIQDLLDTLNNPRVKFWLHDFFSVCPGYLLLRNNVEYCGAPDIDSNACQICMYGNLRYQHLEAFESLFLNKSIGVIAPSDFALSLWQEKFPIKNYPGTVCPHAQLAWKEKKPVIPRNSKLKVAFVGYPMMHKGWCTWLTLTSKLQGDPRYHFYLFSSRRPFSRNFTRVSVAVTKEKRSKMLQVLQENKIDIAFLWSICPETFSFTLYESLAAGCYILTNKNSGNIQNFIHQYPQFGLVVKEEEALLDLFSSGEIIRLIGTYQKDGRPTAEILNNTKC